MSYFTSSSFLSQLNESAASNFLIMKVGSERFPPHQLLFCLLAHHQWRLTEAKYCTEVKYCTTAKPRNLHLVATVCATSPTNCAKCAVKLPNRMQVGRISQWDPFTAVHTTTPARVVVKGGEAVYGTPFSTGTYSGVVDQCFPSHHRSSPSINEVVYKAWQGTRTSIEGCREDGRHASHTHTRTHNAPI